MKHLFSKHTAKDSHSPSYSYSQPRCACFYNKCALIAALQTILGWHQQFHHFHFAVQWIHWTKGSKEETNWKMSLYLRYNRPRFKSKQASWTYSQLTFLLPPRLTFSPQNLHMTTFEPKFIKKAEGINT